MLRFPFSNDALQPLCPKLASRCIREPGGRRLRTGCPTHSASELLVKRDRDSSDSHTTIILRGTSRSSAVAVAVG